MVETIEWTDAGVVMIDQTRLPREERYVTCRTYEEVAEAIRSMVIRGAPAIGVAAAMGIALGMAQADAGNIELEFTKICDTLARTRPTAVNLFWAIDRMKRAFAESSGLPLPRLRERLITEAQQIRLEDIAINEAIGRNGVALVPRLTCARELETGELVDVPVDELEFRRLLRLVYRKNSKLSYAATAFLQTVRSMATDVGAPFHYQVER